MSGIYKQCTSTSERGGRSYRKIISVSQSQYRVDHQTVKKITLVLDGGSTGECSPGRREPPQEYSYPTTQEKSRRKPKDKQKMKDEEKESLKWVTLRLEMVAVWL